MKTLFFALLSFVFCITADAQRFLSLSTGINYTDFISLGKVSGHYYFSSPKNTLGFHADLGYEFSLSNTFHQRVAVALSTEHGDIYFGSGGLGGGWGRNYHIKNLILSKIEYYPLGISFFKKNTVFSIRNLFSD